MQKPQITDKDHEGMFWMLISGFIFFASLVSLIIYLIFCQ